MPRPYPLSVQLALRYAAAISVLLGAFAVFCYAGYQAASRRAFDRHLHHELAAVTPFVQASPEGLSGEALDSSDVVAMQLQGAAGTYVRLLAPDGTVRYRSPNFDGQPPLSVWLPDRRKGDAVTKARTWGGAPTRTLVAPLPAKAGWVEVTGYVWGGVRELRDLAWTLALGVVAGVLFALVSGWWLARRALRPVSVLTDAARELTEPGAPWGGRLPSSFRTRDELTRLAETFNGLIGRLEDSAARERRFTANAAHELLTPLATLRSEAEVTLRREREPLAYREALTHIVADVAHLTATVRGLLELSRAETLSRTSEARLDLSRLVAERAERLQDPATERGLELDVHAAGGVLVAAQAAPLTEVVDNLLQNAVKYTPPGGRIQVTLSHGPSASGAVRSEVRGGTTRLEVRDTGTGFDQEMCERLFDRFYRSDQPEVQAERGSGLGLSIVKAIAEAYGGAVGCASEGPGHGALFWVELPCLGPHE